MDYPDECTDCGARGDVQYCEGCNAAFCNSHIAKHEIMCDAGEVAEVSPDEIDDDETDYSGSD